MNKPVLCQTQRDEPRLQEVIEYLEGGPMPGRRLLRGILEQFEIMEGVLYEYNV